MAANVQGVYAKVQSMLLEFAQNVTLEKDYSFSLRHGSARMWIRVWARPEGEATFVALTVPVLQKISGKPELFEWVARHADDYVFGHLSLEEWDSGFCVFFTHTLLGDYLDEEELKHAVIGILASADELDDELKGMFGGERFHED